MHSKTNILFLKSAPLSLQSEEVRNLTSGRTALVSMQALVRKPTGSMGKVSGKKPYKGAKRLA
ncbi:hypothetical protein HpJP0108_11350 [Helicobacter pylori]|uniref:hypothetical protein n=1 Tax=Helicobacter pylori TaxID=210 RepID=UPI001AA29FD6|nr:hypothetical protein [Helicobacter pylori]GHR82825.1 hypothetical protein JP0108_11320 [Helicobacter pylori]